MSFSDVPDKLELTLRITLIDENSSVERADYKYWVFFEEQNFDDRFVLGLIFLSGLNILKKLSCLTAILSDEASCISNEEFSAFVSELSCSDVSIMIILI